MAITYGPFNSGPGANFYQDKWVKMSRQWQVSGVNAGELNEFEVYADSSGMQVKVKSGVAWLRGQYIESDAEVIKAIAASNPTYGRIDLVILRVDWINMVCEIAVLTGTPAASPAEPALTQNTSVWEIPIGKVTVDAAATTIAANKASASRKWSNLVTIPIIIGNGVTVIPTGVVGYIPIDMDLKLQRWTLVGDVSGSIVIDIWNDYDGTFPPDVADTIVGGGGTKPTLSSAQKNTAFMTGWARTLIGSGTHLALKVDSATTVKQVTLALIGYRP